MGSGSQNDVGEADGVSVGSTKPSTVGESVGADVGATVVGAKVGGGVLIQNILDRLPTLRLSVWHCTLLLHTRMLVIFGQSMVGELVGAVGESVGNAVGMLVGRLVGFRVGESVGLWVGLFDGRRVGRNVGFWVGFSVGEIVGSSVGKKVGEAVLMSTSLLLLHLNGPLPLFEEAAMSERLTVHCPPTFVVISPQTCS